MTSRLTILAGKVKVNNLSRPSRNPQAVIGVSAFGHDTAACLVHSGSGRMCAAVAEERISGRKHDTFFPIGALRSCLEVARERGLVITDVAVAHEAEAFIREALPRELLRGTGIVLKSPVGVKDLLRLFWIDAQRIDQSVDLAQVAMPRYGTVDELALDARSRPIVRWYYDWALFHHYVAALAARLCGAPWNQVPHHVAHAASAFFNSDFQEATVITIDGQGEADTTAVFLAKNGSLQRLSTSWWPNSLGAFYLSATAHLGFELGDEGKVMGMAAYGKARYASTLLRAIKVSEDAVLSIGSSELMTVSASDAFPHGTLAFSQRLETLVPKRKPSEEIRQCHLDFAASVQEALETVAVDVVKKAIALTGCGAVALAGGVCLNARMNREIRRLSGCKHLFVFPASGDDGTAIGAAQLVARRVVSDARSRTAFSCFLAPRDARSLDVALASRDVRFTRPQSCSFELARSLADGYIVARVSGWGEFGPRALGHRSILADPRDASTRYVLNLRIKRREAFRPFAPVCPVGDASRFFDVSDPYPYMVEVVGVAEGAQSLIPAAIHVDGTARLQTIDHESDPELYRLLREFERCTGVPVLINTSFNVAGEPIVHSVDDAIDAFLFMDVDYLWIDDVIVRRAHNLHLRAAATLNELLEARRRRNRGLLDPPIDLDLSTEAALSRFAS